MGIHVESEEFGFRPESLSVVHSCCRRNQNATLSFTFADLTCSLIFLLESSVIQLMVSREVVRKSIARLCGVEVAAS